MRQDHCQVKKKKIDLLDVEKDENFITLVEVTPSADLLRSSFDDYFKTLEKLRTRARRE